MGTVDEVAAYGVQLAGEAEYREAINVCVQRST